MTMSSLQLRFKNVCIYQTITKNLNIYIIKICICTYIDDYFQFTAIIKFSAISQVGAIASAL